MHVDDLLINVAGCLGKKLRPKILGRSLESNVMFLTHTNYICHVNLHGNN